MNDMILHDDRDTIIAGLREQLRQTREELAQERSKGGQVERGAQALRTVLTPLYGALQHIFGETEAMGLPEAQPTAHAPKKNAAWDSWKERLSGPAGKMIDVLMIHGSLTADQLRIHLGFATRTCYNIIGELSRAKLIEKNSGKVSLKEL